MQGTVSEAGKKLSKFRVDNISTSIYNSTYMMQVHVCLFVLNHKRLCSDSYFMVRIAHGLNSFYGSTCDQKVAVEVRCNVNVDDAMAAV